MAAKIDFNMFCLIFLFFLIVNKSFSFTIANDDEKSCSCYDVCNKNFTTDSIKDVQKIRACQTGCRFYSLILHTSHEVNLAKDSDHAKEDCLSSCSESYNNLFEVSACKFGCSAVESLRVSCVLFENQLPQTSYSLLIEESDGLIHPGEPEPDDVLMDPGLRKQFEKTLEALLETKPKLPEIHFRNLPIRNQKSEYSHANFKCPKFYNFDSKFEFRNGKIIIGDLYLFLGVFVFLIICFILGYHLEARYMKLVEMQMTRTDDFSHGEPLLREDMCQDLTVKEKVPHDFIQKSETLEGTGGQEQAESKFGNITLVFHNDDLSKENQNDENYPKI